MVSLNSVHTTTARKRKIEKLLEEEGMLTSEEIFNKFVELKIEEGLSISVVRATLANMKQITVRIGKWGRKPSNPGKSEQNACVAYYTLGNEPDEPRITSDGTIIGTATGSTYTKTVSRDGTIEMRRVRTLVAENEPAYDIHALPKAFFVSARRS